MGMNTWTVAEAKAKFSEVIEEAQSRRMETMDVFLAATVKTQHLTLVTRNVGDFSGIVRDLLNPWT